MIKKIIKKLLHPRMINLLKSPLYELRNIREDLKSYFGKYNYPYKIIFVAGLPKSGTTWVENFFSKIPGYVIRSLSGDQEYIQNHGIPENGFKYFPVKCYSCLKTHANPTIENFKSLDKNGIKKIVVIYRDPRDVAVSRYFHLCKSPKKPSEPYYMDYTSMDKNDAIKHSIMIIKKEFFKWIDGWLDYASENPDMISVIKYEDMYSDTLISFKKISYHYGLNLDDKQIILILDSLKNMKKGFNNNKLAGEKSTFRKGGSGGWRDHFTAEHIDLFTNKEKEMLSKFGYDNF